MRSLIPPDLFTIREVPDTRNEPAILTDRDPGYLGEFTRVFTEIVPGFLPKFPRNTFLLPCQIPVPEIMKYEIIGDNQQMAKMDLQPGEGIFAEAGSMVNMSGNMAMESQLKGGVIAGLKRAVTGESLFLTRFAPRDGAGFVSFAGTMTGKIFTVRISPGKDFIAQKSSFICCEESVSLDIAVTEKIRAGFFGGEGFLLQRMTGVGNVFLHCCGDIIEMDLKDREVVKVQTGLVVGFENTVTYDIALAGGITTALFGGEGLFVTTLTGPGKVVLQSMDFAKIAATILPYLPTPEPKGK